MKTLFGTSGIRGSAKDLFTDQFCFDIGRAFARFLAKHGKTGGVAVGMDPRGSSPRIKGYIETGLFFEGREVFSQGATPVPSMCNLLNVSEYYAGSVMVSGSHIKPDLNGVKFFAFGEEIWKKHEKQIESAYYTLKGSVDVHAVKNPEVHNELRANREYIEVLLKLADGPFPQWKVVVDPGDGAQSDTMPQVLRTLGIQVHELHATIQGEFYARDTEHLPDMRGLMDEVVRSGSDFGIGYDADGDRVVFIDGNGNFIPGDYSATIIARELAKYSLVTTIAASQVVDSIGKKVYRTKVGSPYILEKMKKTGANIGFEPNGGCFFPDIMMTRDGGSTTINFLNILKKSGKKINELVGELPTYFLMKDKVDYEWGLEKKILREAKLRFRGINYEALDGLKVWLDDNTWILFRSSKNAPEFRVFVESKQQSKSQELLSEGTKLVRDVTASK